MDIAIALGTIACAIVLALYVTWLFVERVKRKDNMAKSFTQWLKHLFEVVWGL
jgi:uncharacterized membrane protein YukC